MNAALSNEICFVCDEKFTGISKNIIAASTTYSKKLIINIISNIVGNDCLIIVTENDFMCEACFSLFDQMDLFEKNLGDIKLILHNRLTNKYGLANSTGSCNKIVVCINFFIFHIFVFKLLGLLLNPLNYMS